MPLSPATIALIEAALQSKVDADNMDQDLSNKNQILTDAQNSVIIAQNSDVEAHQKATADAHTALEALAAEFGVPLTTNGLKSFNVPLAMHPTVSQALKLGIPWDQILQILMTKGMEALKALIALIMGA